MTNTYNTHSSFFSYQQNNLHCENVPVDALAKEYGTPLYVYSKAALLHAFQGYQQGLEGIPHLIAFAVKANGNLSILKLLGEKGAGADLTSGGEMHSALKAGIPTEKLVFSGVGKSDTEIRDAVEAGVLMLNIESEPELDNIQAIAASLGKTANIAVRVNPNIDAKTHPKISTGLKEHKFGVPAERAVALYERAAAMPNIYIRGIAAHVGSSLPDTEPLLHAVEKLLDFKAQLQAKGIKITHFDVGGGLGIQYQNENQETPNQYAGKLRDRLKDEGVTLVVEPGRSIVGNASVLAAQILYVKRTDDRTFVVVDAGMNDLARPAIYGAYHEIVPVNHADGAAETVDVVGPVCESSDVFGKQRVLPNCERGQYLAMCSAGAYGYAMASYYNGRVRPAEVLVDGSTHRLIRRRETHEDLWRNQVIS